MKILKMTTAFLLFVLMIAGNSSVCSGKSLPICLSWADSIPKDRAGTISTSKSYMYVQEKMDGSCHLVQNWKLRIYYVEPYAVTSHQRLRYRIYDSHRNLLVKTNEAGVIDNAVCADTLSPRIKTGENWLTIDLSCPGVFDIYNYYYLEVWNGKGEVSYLRFICMPSLYNQ